MNFLPASDLYQNEVIDLFQVLNRYLILNKLSQLLIQMDYLQTIVYMNVISYVLILTIACLKGYSMPPNTNPSDPTITQDQEKSLLHGEIYSYQTEASTSMITQPYRKGTSMLVPLDPILFLLSILIYHKQSHHTDIGSMIPPPDITISYILRCQKIMQHMMTFLQ